MKAKFLHNTGWILIVVLTLIPLVFWSLSEPLHFRFIGDTALRTFAKSMRSAGQILGLIGMAMFAINLVLSARLKWIEGMFGGMNKVYIAHHILGGVSFVFLLFHPLFLTAQYLTSFFGGKKAVQLLIFNSSDAVAYGIIALGLMILFLILTFFVKLPYQYWKLSHKFLGLAFFFASLHVLLIPSDVTYLKYLQYYMWFLVGIGVVSLIYRTVLGFMLIPRRSFVVERVEQIDKAIVEIALRAKDGKPFDFSAGQFVFIGFPGTPGLEEVHPFSISSSPKSSELTIGVKALGDFTAKLNTLVSGAEAVIEGPFGRTSYAYVPNKEQIWIAGGIGITPFLGMARDLSVDDEHHVTLFYALRDSSETAFVKELQSLSVQKPHLKFVPWYSDTMGFLNVEGIIKHSEGILGKDVILCGPPVMMRTLKQQFTKYKIPLSSIHSEEFALN